VHRSCITVGHLQCIDGSLYGDGSVSVWLTFRLVDSVVPPSTSLDYRGSAACCSNDLLVQLYVEQFEHEVMKKADMDSSNEVVHQVLVYSICP
jgi:hypothetical protein